MTPTESQSYAQQVATKSLSIDRERLPTRSSQDRYHLGNYLLSPDRIRSLTRLDSKRSLIAIMGVWFSILSLLAVIRFLLPETTLPFLYVPLIFLIAGRQGALLQLVHEAAHGLLFSQPQWNTRLANFFCAYPIGITLEGYQKGHLIHHRYTNTPKDSPADTEKYRINDVRNPQLYLLFLKDLLGLSALRVFLAYKTSNHQTLSRRQRLIKTAERLIPLCMVQVVLLTLLFHGSLMAYVLFWVIPAMGPHMFLMRIRGIAEHGLPGQIKASIRTPDEGAFHTRSFLTPVNTYKFRPFVWLEKLLIGSFHVHYHHEHHLLPRVPYYRLPELHRIIASQSHRLHPECYAKGYFWAAMRSVMPSP